MLCKLTPAALVMLASSVGAQDCSMLDMNGCGCVNVISYTIMLQHVADGGPSQGDFDNDGDTDGIDLAFFAANFASCAGSNTISTSLPESAPYMTLNVEPALQPDGSTGYDILVQLPDADAELVGVTHATVTQGGNPVFADTAASAGIGTHLPLPESLFTALDVPFDSFITIGDRSAEPAPVVPITIDLDLSAFENDREIQAPTGWTPDITVVGTPASPGLGGAAGNTGNRVLIASLVGNLGIGSFGIAYTHEGRLFVREAGATINSNPCVADVTYDSVLSPVDFTAWINAFNQGLAECDQNADGACTPIDFTAWIANFNAGCP
ncbi:MAG: hypothetical protein ED559_00765 [Phycisphaera sp.]|nr:MAG: hypothetical protein ED559_00765 [Phycisphaera sp.]